MITTDELRAKTIKILDSYSISLDTALPELARIANNIGTPETCAADRNKTIDYLDAVTGFCISQDKSASMTAAQASAKLMNYASHAAKCNWDRLRIGDIFKEVIFANNCATLYTRWLDVSHWAREKLGLNASESEYREFFAEICQKHLTGESIPQRPDPFGGKKETHRVG